MTAAQIWKILISEEHLEEHYFEKIKGKPSIGMDKVTPQKFEAELKDNIQIIIRKINNKTYHFTRYKQLLFTKGASKKPRAICVPTLRDKLVASVINELLFKVYDKECKTPLPQLVIEDIHKEINNYQYFIKLDIESFYASINQKKLMKILHRKIRKEEILSVIYNAIRTEAISYPIREKVKRTEREKGIPEGLPISNALANVFMSDIDKKYSNMKEIAYYRYVDDILILVNDKLFENIKEQIEKDISVLDLKFNEKKDDGFVADGFEYLGYSFCRDNITVRSSSILKIEQSIEDLFREIKNNNLEYIQWKINLKITGFILEEHKYGWMFFYSQIEDINLLFHLDKVVEKLVTRYELNEKIKLKRFVRTYHEIRFALHETKYIPNLDALTIEDKRALVSDIYSVDLTDKSDEQVEIQFRRIMKKEIRDIEKDVQNIS